MNTVVNLNLFDGGMTGDDRTTAVNAASLVKHFDPVSRPHRLTPYNETQDGDAAAATHAITDFINYTTGIGDLFGLGVINDVAAADEHARVWVKNDLTTGSAWSTFSNNTSTLHSSPVRGFFPQYHGAAYIATSTGVISKCKLDGTSFTDTATTLTKDPTANGVVHSKDDILYVPCGNIIARNNNDVWTDNALVLPTNFSINAICEFNDFLAIGCSSANGKSVVYLWDRNSQLTIVSASLDWGYGTIKVLRQVEDYLIGVSVVATSVNGIYPRMVFRKYLSGAGGVIFNQLFASSTVGLQVLSNTYKQNNRLYFAGGITIDGVLHNGIFAIERPVGRTEFSVWIDKLPNNDTAIAASSLTGFIFIDDYVYISYNSSGYSIKFTKSGTLNHGATALWETPWNPGMAIKDRTRNKTLKAVALTNIPIGVDGGQVVVDYKVDAGSWTTIFTTTTANIVTTEAFKDTNGNSFTSGREYKFRIKAGGASGDVVEPTELKYSYEVLESII